MSHQAVKTIQTSVPPVSQPVDRGMPVDQLGMNLMPNAPVIFRLGSVVDDTKLTAGEIAVMLARGDIPQKRSVLGDP
jgi:hypothetical protein